MVDGPKARKHHTPIQRPPMREIAWSVFAAGVGIWAIGVIGESFAGTLGATFVIGAFGASAVLLFGAPNSPLAQPYNVLVGHVLSALIGVTVVRVAGAADAVAMACAVALAIGAMQLTRSVHPPGGATALIAVIGGEPVHALGYMYLVAPVGLGALVLLGVALLTNNMGARRRWPVFWLPLERLQPQAPVPAVESRPQER